MLDETMSSEMLQNLPYFWNKKTQSLLEMKNGKKTIWVFLFQNYVPILKHYTRQFHQA